MSGILFESQITMHLIQRVDIVRSKKLKIVSLFSLAASINAIDSMGPRPALETHVTTVNPSIIVRRFTQRYFVSKLVFPLCLGNYIKFQPPMAHAFT